MFDCCFIPVMNLNLWMLCCFWWVPLEKALYHFFLNYGYNCAFIHKWRHPWRRCQNHNQSHRLPPSLVPQLLLPLITETWMKMSQTVKKSVKSWAAWRRSRREALVVARHPRDSRLGLRVTSTSEISVTIVIGWVAYEFLQWSGGSCASKGGWFLTLTLKRCCHHRSPLETTCNGIIEYDLLDS